MPNADVRAAARTTNDRPWESIRPLGLSFGWNRQETAEHVLSPAELVLLLMDVITSNGNLLLGVSPDDHGRLPESQRASLAALGDWLRTHGDAVYGTEPWLNPRSTTADGRVVYLTRTAVALYAVVEGELRGDTVIADLHLDTDSELTLLHAPQARVSHTPGGRGSVIHLPERSPGSGIATTLRITPVPR